MLPIGKRSAEYFAHHGAGLFTPEVLMAADVSVSECFTLSHQITEGFLKGEYDAVKLCYTRFDSMMTQTATTLEVLPLTIEPTEAQKAEARRSQILYKPSCEEVFGAIIPEYVAGVLYGAVCESVASELAARRTAMDAATKNAGEMIEHLNLYYNRARQAAITQEIPRSWLVRKLKKLNQPLSTRYRSTAPLVGEPLAEEMKLWRNAKASPR